MVTVREEMRKGPWTEQEDMQLVCTVRLLGDRSWDSIAQVSGLNRSGKSCRMRWVNYLHPSHKHRRLSPQEERLVIDLHARWGNSWARIARRLPGRTDNDIKNYWKTRMRTKAQERGMSISPSSSSFSTNVAPVLPPVTAPVDGMSCGDTQNVNVSSCITGNSSDLDSTDGFPMDQIWREMETPLQQVPASLPQGIHQADEKTCSSVPFCSPSPATAATMWSDQCPDVFWNMAAEEINQDVCSTIWLW